MELYQYKILETIVTIMVYWVLKKAIYRLVKRNQKKQTILEVRGVMVKKVINVFLLTVSTVVILLIWGVKQSDLAVFIGSALTLVGVALFAQWSLLSNITASIILFFNHPIRINDTIAILEGKEYVIEGKIINIGIFFITLLTEEGEELTLPNNMFIQKSIVKKLEPSQNNEVA